MKTKQSAEDYLKTIYVLSKTREVHGADIAEAMGFSRPTVSVALKTLEQDGYVTLDKDRAVSLTSLGKQVAQHTYERNQTFCQLLTSLGVQDEIAQRDACRLEHAVSPESFAALKKIIPEELSTG